MIFPAFLAFVVAANYFLFRFFVRELERKAAWKVILAVALVVTAARTTAVGLGTYLLQSSGGPIQIPAYFLVNVGLPEIALAGRERLGGAESYLIRAMVSVGAGSMLWVGCVGLIALVFRRRTQRSRQNHQAGEQRIDH